MTVYVNGASGILLHSQFDHDKYYCMYCDEGPYNSARYDGPAQPKDEELIPCCEDCDLPDEPSWDEMPYGGRNPLARR